MSDRARKRPFRWHIVVFLAPAVLIYTAIMIIPLFGTLKPVAVLRARRMAAACSWGWRISRRCLATPAGLTVSGTRRATTCGSSSSICWCKNPIGIALAAILSAPKLRFAAFYRTAIFIPAILSFVIVGFVWKLILSPLWGVAPTFMDALGLGDWFAPWLGLERSALTTLALISVWQFVGIPMMLIYAALLSIPDEVLEAAEMDGITGTKPVLEDQAAADPAHHRDHFHPDIRGQFQRVRPDLCDPRCAGGAEFYKPTFWGRSCSAPSSGSSCNWATRIWAQPWRR